MKVSLTQFQDWLINKGLKKRTVENYIYYFNKFTYGVYNQEVVSRFLSLEANRNSVARSFLLNLRKYLLVHHNELGLSPDVKTDVAAVELPKMTGRKKFRIVNYLTKDQIHKLENYLPDERYKIGALILYYCGLRLGGLLKIRIINFNWDKWKLDVSQMGECRVFEKGDKEGIALVPPEIMTRLAKFIRNNDFPSVNSYLFIGSKKINVKLKSVERDWENRIRKAGIASGITKLDENGKVIKETAVWPHKLRHSYATYLLNVVGLNMKEVQELMRHSDISSTQRYTHVDQEDYKKKLKDMY